MDTEISMCYDVTHAGSEDTSKEIVMGATATLTIRLPEEEKRLISDYASAFGISVSELARRSVMEKIENEIDTRDLLEAIEEDDGERYSMTDVLDLLREAK
jgi:uncharacterized protein (DUF1778 family)